MARQLQGLSQRAYAVRRGVSHTAVQKAVAAGRITTFRDGSIDPEAADRQWAANTDETKSANSVSGDPKHRRDPTGPPAPAGSAPAANGHAAEAPRNGRDGGGTIYTQARGQREAAAALITRLKYEREAGSLTDSAGVEAGAVASAMQTKNAILAMPAQVGPQVFKAATLEECMKILAGWTVRVCKDLETPPPRPTTELPS